MSLLKILENTSLQNELKFFCLFFKINFKFSIKRYADLLYQSFEDLCKTSTKFEFTEKSQEWCKILCSSSTSKFLFYENNSLQEYVAKKIKCHEKNGVAGFVFESNRPMIISEIRKNHFFNPNIDISSLLPILYYPVRFQK